MKDFFKFVDAFVSGKGVSPLDFILKGGSDVYEKAVFSGCLM